MFDESTDISVTRNLVIDIRFLETGGTYLLSISDLERANADKIYCKSLYLL